MSEGAPNFPDKTVVFTKNRIKFKDKKLEQLFDSPYMVQPIKAGAIYKFSKEYNREDKKKYMVDIEGSTKFVLDIDFTNKVKANILHNRYWVMREIKWLVPVIISVAALVISIIALKQPTK